MPAGGRHFERALRLRLTFHIREVGIGRRGEFSLCFGTRHGLPPAQMRADIEKRPGLIDIGAVDERGLVGAAARQDERAPVPRRAPGHRERAADRAQLAGERELARELVFREVRRAELL